MSPDPILDPFRALVRHRPTALLCASGERRATAGDVDGSSAEPTRLLAGLRLPPGSVVAVVVPDGPAFLSALVAVRANGLVALLLDAGSPAPEVERCQDALGASAALRCRTGWPEGPTDWTAGRIESGREPAVHPGAAVIKLTSGSTGRPRGVVTPPEALAADDDQLFASMGLSAADRLLASVPLGHSYGLSSLALPALRRGNLLVFPEPGSPFAPIETAAAWDVTFFPTTPAWLGGLLRVAEVPAWPPSLRLTISAGARLEGELAARFRGVTGRRVHTFYGSSECGGICFDREGGAAERGTVGAPVAGVEVEIEPLEDGGAEGIVSVRSAAVATGYAPDPDPHLAGGRFLTSDLASFVGAEVALAGRVDDLINVRGKKVSPREVEAVLRGLPGVIEVAVVGVPSPGTGGHTVRAVVAAPPGSTSAAAVVAHCRQRLAPYKVPRSVVLVEALPRTARGKLDRRALLGADPAEVRE